MTAPIELGFQPSPQQLRAWQLQKDGATSSAILCALRIEGDLDRRTLRRALAATVARHEILPFVRSMLWARFLFSEKAT